MANHNNHDIQGRIAELALAKLGKVEVKPEPGRFVVQTRMGVTIIDGDLGDVQAYLSELLSWAAEEAARELGYQ